MKMRKIIHIDMDAFYASIEQRDDVSLRGLPIAVGGSSKRGVVMTASYEAREFGVRSAMPVFKAQRLCPELIIVRPHFERYKAASRQFREILQSYSSIIEPLSLDEAFIDVTSISNAKLPATRIAQDIRSKIAQNIAVTASAGVSYNKFLAKLASGLNKPDGVFVIKPHQAEKILADLPIEKFHGVGPATAKRLNSAGIHTGRDLQDLSEIEARQLPGSSGSWFWQLARGIDERPVSADSARKSISIETTFVDNISLPSALEEPLAKLAHELADRCTKAGFLARTLTLKLKYEDFQIRTRSQTFEHLPLNGGTISTAARFILFSQPLDKPVRLLGLGLSNPIDPDIATDQLDLPFKDSRNA